MSAAPRKPEQDKAVRICISIPKSLSDELDRFCADHDRNQSWVVKQALREYIKAKGADE